MQYILMALMAAGIVAADQISKYFTVLHIGPGEQLSAIDGLFHFTYTENRGAAWSSFEGMQWLFALIFLVFTLALIWEFKKGSLGFSRFERWCLVAVWAGGLGNMIDRVRLGYVVDMIRVEFMDFPVFNVADIFITCGCVALLVHLVFFNREFWKSNKEKGHDTDR